ncbi:hypothetical protein C1H76_1466 [Elsinoe australis]|uniref:Uncharacterized protein n=1 Tax=Elsinoe australis TaxID=40998 RepID=A0A4V6DXQ1_9PEZI|nr:hypothetical protein C1H76_1466 [Elsinoe australis]
MPNIILVGTLDTKAHEFRYLYDQLKSVPFDDGTPINVTLIDCGREPTHDDRISITQSELISKHSQREPENVAELPRGDVITFMIDCTTACVRELVEQGDVHGVIGAGGSGGTSLIASVMRNAAPIGMPKLIVSTVASGDTGPLVGETDITMMYSVVDIAGSNSLLRNILSNAASAMVGMASNYQNVVHQRDSRSRTKIGITMFGVTTPGVDAIRERLESKFGAEVFVFHATGHGGRAMERLIEQGQLDAVVDLTTTEVCDFLMGGNMSAGPSRLEAALRASIPTIISLGATDMVNFGPKQTVPIKYEGRLLFEHNPTVTLMRTTPEECKQVAEFIIAKLEKFAKSPSQVQVWMPQGGVSMIAVPGGPFADEAADDAMFNTLRRGLEGSAVKVVADDRDINNSSFATAIADRIMEMVESDTKAM